MGQGPLDLMQELQKAITALTSLLCWAKLSSSPPPNIHFLGLYNKDFTLMTCTFICYWWVEARQCHINNTVVYMYDASPQTMILYLMLARKDPPFFFYLVSRPNFSHLKYSHGPQLVLPLHLDEHFHPNSVVTCTYLFWNMFIHHSLSFVYLSFLMKKIQFELKLLNNSFPFLLPFQKFPSERFLLLIAWVTLGS